MHKITRHEAHEMKLNSLVEGQELQMVTLRLPAAKYLDIRTDRVDDLFYDDTEIRTVVCGNRLEMADAVYSLREAGYAVPRLSRSDEEAMTIRYYIPFGDQGSYPQEPVVSEAVYNRSCSLEVFDAA